MSRVSSCPARPTNGMPCLSSSAPGPSPTNIRSAAGSPTPNTTWVRVSASGHRVQPSASSRSGVEARPPSRRSPARVIGATVGGGHRRSVCPHCRPHGLGHHLGGGHPQPVEVAPPPTPVATAITRSPSKRVCDGSQRPGQAVVAGLGEQEAVRLREHGRRWRRARASCARRRPSGSGNAGPPGGAVDPARTAPSRSSTSPTAFTTASAPTVASVDARHSRCRGRPAPRGRRPATCRRARRARRRPTEGRGRVAASAAVGRGRDLPPRPAARRRRSTRSKIAAVGTIGTAPGAREHATRPARRGDCITPSAAARPNAEPPVKTTASTCIDRARRPRAARARGVAGAPPRTSPDPTVPAGAAPR